MGRRFAWPEAKLKYGHTAERASLVTPCTDEPSNSSSSIERLLALVVPDEHSAAAADASSI